MEVFHPQMIHAARKNLRGYARKTPLVYSPALSQRCGCRIHLKIECWQTCGCFKIRGATNFLMARHEEAKTKGVVTASSGNHALALAYGASRMGIQKIKIFAPEDADPAKVDKIKLFGTVSFDHRQKGACDPMSKKKEIIATPANPDLPFSTVVGFERLVFVSGIVGRDPETGRMATGDMTAQTRQALTNISQQMGKAGITLKNALKATVFVTDMKRFKEMNKAYLEFFQEGLPARSCVGVTALPDPEALVEIEVIAHR